MVSPVRFEFVGILGLVALRVCGCDARYVNRQKVAYETPIDGLRGRYESRNHNRFTSFLVVGMSEKTLFKAADMKYWKNKRQFEENFDIIVKLKGMAA